MNGLATVDTRVNSLEEDKDPQLCRVGIIWGIPTSMVNKMTILPWPVFWLQPVALSGESKSGWKVIQGSFSPNSVEHMKLFLHGIIAPFLTKIFTFVARIRLLEAAVRFTDTHTC